MKRAQVSFRAPQRARNPQPTERDSNLRRGFLAVFAARNDTVCYALLLLALLLACNRGDPIANAVNAAVDAAEDRDAGAVMKHVASSYEGRADVEQTLRRYFFAYRAINISVSDLQTRHDEKEGWASFRVSFTGVPKEIGGIAEMVPRAATYQFQVWLVQEGGAWKIADAKYEQLSSS